jgi:hypothetical protein
VQAKHMSLKDVQSTLLAGLFLTLASTHANAEENYNQKCTVVFDDPKGSTRLISEDADYRGIDPKIFAEVKNSFVLYKTNKIPTYMCNKTCKIEFTFPDVYEINPQKYNIQVKEHLVVCTYNQKKCLWRDCKNGYLKYFGYSLYFDNQSIRISAMRTFETDGTFNIDDWYGIPEYGAAAGYTLDWSSRSLSKNLLIEFFVSLKE